MAQSNTKGGWCCKCKKWVINGKGYAIKTYGSGWKVIHIHCHQERIEQEKERLKLAMKLANERNKL